MHKVKEHTRRVVIGIAGGVVLLAGIIAVPYPGPGWLIIFTGLAILSTEFAWAQRLLDHARGKYDSWVQWLKRQNIAVRLLVLGFTGCVIVVTIWLFNGYGLINSWLQLDLDWLRSPFLK